MSRRPSLLALLAPEEDLTDAFERAPNNNSTDTLMSDETFDDFEEYESVYKPTDDDVDFILTNREIILAAILLYKFDYKVPPRLQVLKTLGKDMCDVLSNEGLSALGGYLYGPIRDYRGLEAGLRRYSDYIPEFAEVVHDNCVTIKDLVSKASNLADELCSMKDVMLAVLNGGRGSYSQWVQSLGPEVRQTLYRVSKQVNDYLLHRVAVDPRKSDDEVYLTRFRLHQIATYTDEDKLAANIRCASVAFTNCFNGSREFNTTLIQNKYARAFVQSLFNSNSAVKNGGVSHRLLDTIFRVLKGEPLYKHRLSKQRPEGVPLSPLKPTTLEQLVRDDHQLLLALAHLFDITIPRNNLGVIQSAQFDIEALKHKLAGRLARKFVNNEQLIRRFLNAGPDSYVHLEDLADFLCGNPVLTDLLSDHLEQLNEWAKSLEDFQELLAMHKRAEENRRRMESLQRQPLSSLPMPGSPRKLPRKDNGSPAGGPSLKRARPAATSDSEENSPGAKKGNTSPRSKTTAVAPARTGVPKRLNFDMGGSSVFAKPLLVQKRGKPASGVKPKPASLPIKKRPRPSEGAMLPPAASSSEDQAAAIERSDRLRALSDYPAGVPLPPIMRLTPYYSKLREEAHAMGERSFTRKNGLNSRK